MSTRQISDTVEELYGFEVFDAFFTANSPVAVSSARGGLSGRFYRCDSLFSARKRNSEKIGGICKAINADGLTGLKEAVSAAFPQTEFQRCIVGQKYTQIVLSKDRKEFATDLKKIYIAQSRLLPKFATKFPKSGQKKYPHSMKSWSAN